MGKNRKIIYFFLLLLILLLPMGSVKGAWGSKRILGVPPFTKPVCAAGEDMGGFAVPENGRSMTASVYASAGSYSPVALSQPVVSAVKGVYVYDDAGLLDDDQKERLSGHLKKCGQEAGCGIYAVTSSEPGGRTGDQYLEDFYDNGFDTGQIDVDAVLIYLDMKNRYVNVQAYGKAQSKITDRICDKIIDAIYDDLKAGDYYNVIKVYADEAVDYLNYVPIYLRAWVQLIAAFIIGGIAVGVMAANSGGAMTVNADTYLDSRYSGIRARRDDYIRTSVTKRKKPKPSEGGGSSGGGHVSSGGHSHSSGGRSF